MAERPHRLRGSASLGANLIDHSLRECWIIQLVGREAPEAVKRPNDRL
jgi:hypothetical protein